ncbi:MAG: hypothetical protein FWF36_02270 [Propionibacteriaceae bacterium]|nr:hypothetical protein [Propionibacteriaceae bacterium]
MDQHYRVLTVCTGNVCRSPATAAWLVALADRSVAVASAGTAAVVGAPVYLPMAALMTGAGLRVTGFAAHQLTPRMIEHSDLVLTMTAQHRAWVVGRVPAAVRRTFALLEFAQLARVVDVDAQATTAERLRHVVDAVPAARAQLGSAVTDTDVPDPYGLGADAYDLAFGLIEDAVRGILG